ncbi:MAG: thiamine pyrophosphate-binding protein [bacterium]
MSKIKVSDYIAKRLKEVYNVEHFFMVSGGGAMHLNDSFGRYIPDYIANHHEQACAMAAEGYARVNQRLAVVNVTTGPGGLNCLNGVFGQWTDSVPVLYISGQVKFSTTIASCPDVLLRQLGDQEVDIISVVKPLCKYAKMVTEPNEIKYHLDRAIYEATTGRFGPVWLDIPMNVQAMVIDENNLEGWKAGGIDEKPYLHTSIPSYLQETIKKIVFCKRPLIIAGHGIRLSKQEETFYKLLEKLNIPVVTTFNGFDILEDAHPNYIGRIGTVGQRAGNFALQNADLVLCLGTRNNIRQASYNYENFAKNAFKIVVDIDQAELDKPTVIPDMKICADLKDFLPELLKTLQPFNPSTLQPWLKWCQERKEKFSLKNFKEYEQDEKTIDPYIFTNELSKAMKEDDILVMANGSACVCVFQTAEIKKGQRFILNSGDASMGFDLPVAIGASLEAKGRNVICLAGDGSIMMNLQELQTMKHYNLPIKLFVLNNNGYISIQQTQKNFFQGRMTACSIDSGVSIPDFVEVGNAFGLKTVKISSLENLQEQIKQVLDSDGPILCEVMLSPDYIFSPKLSARKLDDGTMVSPSLEDMFPFLDRKEYEENMLK